MVSSPTFLKFLLRVVKVFKEVLTHHLSSSTISNTLPSTIFFPFSSGSPTWCCCRSHLSPWHFPCSKCGVCDQWLWPLGDMPSGPNGLHLQVSHQSVLWAMTLYSLVLPTPHEFTLSIFTHCTIVTSFPRSQAWLCGVVIPENTIDQYLCTLILAHCL